MAEEHIAISVEIARPIRDEATQKLDAAFDKQFAGVPKVSTDGLCCTPTASGQAFLYASWQNRSLLALNQAGLVEKFTDALVRWVRWLLACWHNGRKHLI